MNLFVMEVKAGLSIHRYFYGSRAEATRARPKMRRTYDARRGEIVIKPWPITGQSKAAIAAELNALVAFYCLNEGG